MVRAFPFHFGDLEAWQLDSQREEFFFSFFFLVITLTLFHQELYFPDVEVGNH